IIDSKDFRKKAIAILAPDLVREAYRAMLNRNAEPAALTAYSNALAESGKLGNVLGEILGSAEFFNAQAARQRASKTHLHRSSRQRLLALDLTRPKLVFLHHPKTGGTTLHHILMRGFDEDEICPERFNGLQHYSAGDLARYRYFSGHFDLLSVSLIPGEKKIITMLREPISRLISLYYFQRAHKAE